jgi:hypothetical protein
MMQEELKAISTVVADYFQGAFDANASQLGQAFHPDAKITGLINGKYVEIDVNAFIDRATTAKANNKNQKFDKKITSIDIHTDMAMVKARVLVDDVYFTDFLTLLKIDNCWVIRQKSFTNSI